jgi:hypothetical protein
MHILVFAKTKVVGPRFQLDPHTPVPYTAVIEANTHFHALKGRV